MLADVIASVAADFSASGVDADVVTGTKPPGQGYPNRVAFFPSADVYGANETIGGNPRAICTRRCGADVHVLAVDVQKCEALIHRTIVALHRAAYGNYQITGGAWNTEGAKGGFASEYVLKVLVSVPVVDAPWPTAPSDTAGAHAGEMTFASGTETAC